MTNMIHTNNNFRNVGMIEVLNEPLQNTPGTTGSMLSEFYPTAWQKIRSAEDALGVAGNNRLHIQMMVCIPSSDQTS